MSVAAYEYDTESVWASTAGYHGLRESAQTVKKRANERAADGWELVSFHIVSEGLCIAFRRAILGPPYR